LDFGSQYTQLIARRVRENRVYCVIQPFDFSAEEIRQEDPIGVILSGGPQSVYEPDAAQVDAAIFELGIPVLGICYGMHLTAHQLGGEVEGSEHREYGRAEIDVVESSVLFDGLAAKETVWMSHGDRVGELPEGIGWESSLRAFVSAPLRPMHRRWPSRTGRAGSMASSFIPRSHIPSRGARS
jgi:GMP synthase (glutamine-hydrolysing)